MNGGDTAVDVADGAATPEPQLWTVTHQPAVVVRSAPSVKAEKLGIHVTGSEVSVAYTQAGWARLSSPQEQWMLIDGPLAGFRAALMQRVPQDVAAVVFRARSMLSQALRIAPRVKEVMDGVALAAIPSCAEKLRIAAGGELDASIAMMRGALREMLAVAEEYRVGELVRIYTEIAVLFARTSPARLLLPILEAQSLANILLSAQTFREMSGPSGTIALADELTESPLLTEPPLAEADSIVALHTHAWEVIYAASSAIAERPNLFPGHMTPDMFRCFELCSALLPAAAAAVSWLNTNKMMADNPTVDFIFGSLERRRTRGNRGGDRLKRELWNMIVAYDARELPGAFHFGLHVFELFSTAEGRDELGGGTLTTAAELRVCTAHEHECMRLAVAAIKAEGGPRSIDPRAFVCVFTADEAAHLELHVPAPARAYDRRTALDRWAHPAFTHLRELSVATREVLGRAIFKGSLTVAKKRYEHGSAERMLLGPGESGGRYRCVAPERLLRDGYPQLMSEADVETLKRDRIVVVDHAIPPEVLALARAEALRMDAQGALAGEKNSTYARPVRIEQRPTAASSRGRPRSTRARRCAHSETRRTVHREGHSRSHSPPTGVRVATPSHWVLGFLRLPTASYGSPLPRSCNPGERSTEMALYEEAHLDRLRQQHPGLHDCVRSLWNLPALLGPRLGLAVRVPQTVLLASYPPGALYHRHYDSYDGKDIPRLYARSPPGSMACTP